MKTTDKSSCNILIEVLKSHNVKNIILSPGSRNAPLIIAAARESYFKKTIIRLWEYFKFKKKWNIFDR